MTPVMKRFSEVARVVTGKTPSTANELFFGGHIPFVTPGDLDGEAPIVATKTQLTTEGAGEVNRLPKGSVLVSCIGTLGKVGIAGVEVCTNQQINALVFDESLVEPRWISLLQDSQVLSGGDCPSYNTADNQQITLL